MKKNVLVKAFALTVALSMVPATAFANEIAEGTQETIVESTVVEENIIEDVEEDIIEDVEEDIIEDVEEDIIEDVEEDIIEDVEEDIIEDVEEDIIEDVEEDIIEDVEEDIIEGAAEDNANNGIASLLPAEGEGLVAPLSLMNERAAGFTVTYFNQDSNADLANGIDLAGGIAAGKDAVFFAANAGHSQMMDNPFAYAGKTKIFKGWKLNIPGDATVYQPGTEITQSCELTAVWFEPVQSAVVYVDKETLAVVDVLENENIMLESYTITPERVANGVNDYDYYRETGLGEGWEQANAPEGYKVSGRTFTSDDINYSLTNATEDIIVQGWDPKNGEICGLTSDFYDSGVIHCAILFVSVEKITEEPTTPPTPPTEGGGGIIDGGDGGELAPEPPTEPPTEGGTEDNTPTAPSIPSEDGGNNNTGNTTTIENEEVPLAEAPAVAEETILIDETEVPLADAPVIEAVEEKAVSDVPLTGDVSEVTLFASLMGLSLIGALTALTRRAR